MDDINNIGGETYKVGRGRPPREHQFRSGKSGNPAGRPRKLERIILPIQFRRDLMSRLELPILVRNGEEEVRLPTILAIIEVQVRKALAGHAPNARFLINAYREILEWIALAEPETVNGVELRLDNISNNRREPYNVPVINDAARYIRRKHVSPDKREKRIDHIHIGRKSEGK